MEIKILSQTDNVLLKRKEVSFEIEHRGEPTPSRSTIISKLSAMLDANPELMVLNPLRTRFGVEIARGVVKIYNNPEDMKRIETEARIRKSRIKKEEKSEGSEETGSEEETGGES